MQRPQGKSVFSDEEGNFDKSAMDEFMDKSYIENVWTFARDTSVDLFAATKRGTLEDFL